MGKRKELKHTKKSCGGTYEVLYTEDNLPYLRCENCGHEVKDWVKWHEEYKEYWQDDAKWGQTQHHLTCILGYFTARFEDHYEMPFALSLNERGLFRGQEINVLRKVYNRMGGNARAVKRYIDWYFREKVHRRKKRITTLAFLAVPQLINEFGFYCKSQRVITRDRKLPPNMLSWVDTHAKDVHDYVALNDWGDLHLMLTHFRAGRLMDIEAITSFVSKLKEQNIIDDSLQILNWSDN